MFSKWDVDLHNCVPTQMSLKKDTTNWKMGVKLCCGEKKTSILSLLRVCICVWGGLSMPSCTLCPLIHHSSETSLHSNEATRADNYTHPAWTSSTVPLVNGNLKPPKKFSSKYTDEDQVVLFICDWGGPEARLISSRGMKAYGWGFSNSPRAHNKSLEGGFSSG